MKRLTPHLRQTVIEQGKQAIIRVIYWRQILKKVSSPISHVYKPNVVALLIKPV